MKVVLSIVIAFFIIGCSENAPKETEVVETKKIEVVKEKSTLEKASDKVSKAKDTVVEKASEVKDEVSAKVSQSKEAVSQKTKEVVTSIKDKVAETSAKAIDADLLYNKCAGCHGGMGERAALGKSAVIRDWSAKQIEHALKGYKNGTYGRTMKSMMQSQVRTLSDADIKALATYISDK